MTITIQNIISVVQKKLLPQPFVLALHYPWQVQHPGPSVLHNTSLNLLECRTKKLIKTLFFTIIHQQLYDFRFYTSTCMLVYLKVSNCTPCVYNKGIIYK